MKTAPVPFFVSRLFCLSKNMDDPSRHNLDYQRIERDKPACHDEMYKTRLGCLNILLAVGSLFIAILIATVISGPRNLGTGITLVLLILGGTVFFAAGLVTICVTWRHLNRPVHVIALVGHVIFVLMAIMALIVENI
jgi:hypothetical protein